MIAINESTMPGLKEALDTDGVLTLLQEKLPECRNGCELVRLNIIDVRYRPGGPCWILYRLKMRLSGRRSESQLLSARLLPDPSQFELPVELVKRYRTGGEGALETAALLLPEIPMAVFAFPIDAALPGLFDATDASRMRHHLNRMWERRKIRVRRVIAKPLGYTPHARAAFHYEILSEAKDTGLPEVRRLIGKMHAKKPTARLFADALAVWHAASGRVNLAGPVGYIGSVGLALQEQVRGERLGGLVTSPKFASRVRETARMLAILHELPVPVSSRRKPEDEAQGVHRWAGVLRAIRPDLAGQVDRLRDRLASEIVTRTCMSGPIHADFHHTNVLVDDDEITIIDLDEMAFGDPMVDVGRFMASLRVPAMREFGDPSGLAEAADAFLESYMERTRGDTSRARLFEAASLLTAAASAFRIQREGWREQVGQLLSESERLVRAVVRTCVPTAEASPREPELSDDERKRWATDGVYMQAVLDPHIRKIYDVELTDCRAKAVAGGEANGQVRYKLRGWRGRRRWTLSVDGMHWPKRGAHGLARRLTTLYKALEGTPAAPLLPHPVAVVRSLSMLVCVAPDGPRFSSLLGSDQAHQAAVRVAQALRVLHGTRVELEARHSVDQEIELLRRRVDRASDVMSDLDDVARGLLCDVERRMREAPPILGPSIRTVHPHHLTMGDRVGVAKVEEVSWSHTLIDAADFLARLAVIGIRREVEDEVSAIGEEFRNAYGQCNDLAAFEAGALLRLGAVAAARDQDSAMAAALFRRAEERLAC